MYFLYPINNPRVLGFLEKGFQVVSQGDAYDWVTCRQTEHGVKFQEVSNWDYFEISKVERVDILKEVCRCNFLFC